MAARQDQSLTIALIIFVSLTVLLGAGLVYVNSQRGKLAQEVVVLEGEKTEAQNTARKLQGESEQYRQYIGMGQFDSFDAVDKQYQADMESFASTFAETDQAYRKIVEQLDSEVKRSTQQEDEAKKRVEELKARLAALEAEKEAQIEQFQKQLAQVEADAASERNRFKDDRAALEQARAELKTALERQRKQYEEQIGQVNASLSDVNSELTAVVKSRDKLLDERERESPSFEVADGRVTWVNQANQTVWINLGSSDDLRRQVTFSVFEQDASDAGKADKKASIEVIRLLGDHMAEARITEDSPRNPIMPGDQIYSQVWHRGKKIRFALAGLIDLDGDGDSDLDLARDLIELNGGVIDAYADPKEGVQGELGVSTRYLVLGEYPTQPSQGSLRDSWEMLSEAAETSGVETITLEEFLNQMGYKPSDRSVTLGSDARAEDFTAPKFRPRTPYSSR